MLADLGQERWPWDFAVAQSDPAATTRPFRRYPEAASLLASRAGRACIARADGTRHCLARRQRLGRRKAAGLGGAATQPRRRPRATARRRSRGRIRHRPLRRGHTGAARPRREPHSRRHRPDPHRRVRAHGGRRLGAVATPRRRCIRRLRPRPRRELARTRRRPARALAARRRDRRLGRGARAARRRQPALVRRSGRRD